MVNARRLLDFNRPSTANLRLSTAWTISLLPGCGFSNNLNSTNNEMGFRILSQKHCLHLLRPLIICTNLVFIAQYHIANCVQGFQHFIEKLNASTHVSFKFKNLKL